ncbi:MAG: hypothetical protein AABZ47_16935 [Planctomycetota bacterium]
MSVFTGQYERSIDGKGRIQLPSQFRASLDPKRKGVGMYVQLGEFKGTLAIYTEQGFEEMAARINTETMPGPESRRFELQFYALASAVDVDAQGRFVLPERLRKKAKLGEEIYLVGQKTRIDIWNRADLDREIAMDWEGDDWPDWQGFLRMKPQKP